MQGSSACLAGNVLSNLVLASRVTLHEEARVIRKTRKHAKHVSDVIPRNAFPLLLTVYVNDQSRGQRDSAIIQMQVRTAVKEHIS